MRYAVRPAVLTVKFRLNSPSTRTKYTVYVDHDDAIFLKFNSRGNLDRPAVEVQYWESIRGRCLERLFRARRALDKVKGVPPRPSSLRVPLLVLCLKKNKHYLSVFSVKNLGKKRVSVRFRSNN